MLPIIPYGHSKSRYTPKSAPAKNILSKDNCSRTIASKVIVKQTFTSEDSPAHAFVPRDTHVQTFASKDLHSQTFSSKDPQSQTFSFKDPQSQTFSSKDPQSQTFSSKDPQSQTFSSKDPQSQTFSSKDPQSQTFSSKDPQSQTFSSKDPQSQTFSSKDPQSQTFSSKDPQSQTFSSKDPQSQTFSSKDPQSQTFSSKDPQSQTFSSKDPHGQISKNPLVVSGSRLNHFSTSDRDTTSTLLVNHRLSLRSVASMNLDVVSVPAAIPGALSASVPALPSGARCGRLPDVAPPRADHSRNYGSEPTLTGDVDSECPPGVNDHASAASSEESWHRRRFRRLRKRYNPSASGTAAFPSSASSDSQVNCSTSTPA